MAYPDTSDAPTPRVSPELFVGVASPLWSYFGAAAAGGVAFWWMTRWTQPVNLEAFFERAMKVAPPAPALEAAVEIVEASAQVVLEATEAVLAAVPEPVVEPEPEPTIEPVLEAAPPAEPVVEPVLEAAPPVEPIVEASPEPAPDVGAAPKPKAKKPLPSDNEA
jgi:hypothetical protein